MADAIAISPFTSPPSTPVMQKVSRQIWNSIGLSMIFATKNSFSQILENNPPFSNLKKETPFVSTPLPFSIAAIKTTDV